MSKEPAILQLPQQYPTQPLPYNNTKQQCAQYLTQTQIIPANVQQNIIHQPSNQQRSMSNDNMHKIMCMMREQIQISAKFYKDQMKALLNGQAKEIISLRDKLTQNQRELMKKTSLIEQLKANIENSNKDGGSKKKIVITSPSQHQLSSSPQLNQVAQRISQLQSKLANLELNLIQKHQAQKHLNKKLQYFEKGIIKLMGAKLNGCNAKLDKYMMKKEKQIEKMYADIGNISNLAKNLNGYENTNTSNLPNSSSQPNLTLYKTISSPNIQQKPQISNNLNPFPQTNNIYVRLSKFKQQIADIKQQLKQIVTKQYKYDNYQIEQLRSQLIKIKKYINYSENVHKHQSQGTLFNNSNLSQNNSNSRGIIIQNNPQNPQQIHQHGHQFDKVIILNQSTPNLHHHHQQLNHTYTQGMYNPNNAYASNNKLLKTSNLSTEASHILNNSHINHNKVNRNNINGNKVYSQQPLQIEQIHSATTFTPPSSSNQLNTRQSPISPNTHTNLFKTFQTPSQPLINHNQPKYIQQQHSPSQYQPQQYDQHSQINQYNSPQQQSIQYEAQSHCSQQYTDNQERLLSAIQDLQLATPIHVQIDQTGYLKCIKTGMYLVDKNDDGFQLNQDEIAEFEERGIIKIVTETYQDAWMNNKSHISNNLQKSIKYL